MIHLGLGSRDLFKPLMVILRGRWSLWYGSGAGSHASEGARVGVVMVRSMCVSTPVGLIWVGAPVLISVRLFFWSHSVMSRPRLFAYVA
jgi:hypothetical protein